MDLAVGALGNAVILWSVPLLFLTLGSLEVTMGTGFKRYASESVSLVSNHCQPNAPCSYPTVITNLLL